MKTNEGMTDRVIRMFLGISIAMFFIYQNSIWAFIGLLPFLTGVIGICPLYNILGVKTLEKTTSA